MVASSTINGTPSLLTGEINRIIIEMCRTCVRVFAKQIQKKIAAIKPSIMIYVNKYLVFVSKPLDAFRFKEIDEVSQKQ